MQEPQETQVWSLGQEDPLQKEMATHSSILAWRIPWTRGAWWATVHGISESWTRLKRLSTCFWFCILSFPTSVPLRILLMFQGFDWGFSSNSSPNQSPQSFKCCNTETTTWIIPAFLFFFLSLYWICYTIASVVYVLVFWPQDVWDLSSPTRDGTQHPCIGRWSPNHWTAREVPRPVFITKNLCFIQSEHKYLHFIIRQVPIPHLVVVWPWAKYASVPVL